MTVEAINQTTQTGAASQLGAGKAMGRDDFLKLLIAQLQNQDPLHPLDNQEFAAQLATFNSLDQLIGINQKLDGMQSQQQMLGQLSAASMIGKQIIADGNQVYLAQGTQATIPYALDAAAARVAITITDGQGNLVRTLVGGNQQAGEQTVLWDGKDAAGKTLPAGAYSIQVSALDAAGKKIGATSRTRGIVTGVDFNGGDLLLEIGAVKVPLSAVKGIL
jgi:flagellar basal-body rod modification protein FlgD